jgi:hypothetical protein
MLPRSDGRHLLAALRGKTRRAPETRWNQEIIMVNQNAIVSLAGLWLLTACPAPEPVPEPFPPPPEPQVVLEPTPEPAWSREALEDQPRMHELRARTPAELGFAPGSTEWRPSEREIPPLLRSPAGSQPAANPGAALHLLLREWALADQLGLDVWELTTRVWYADDSNAFGVIQAWGFQDDSVAGQDYRVQLHRAGDRWFVDRMDERFHCWRGVTPEGFCV